MNTFDYFRQICQIPRESGNEEGMRAYLLNWAEENNLEAVRDKAGNIIVYCPASEGCEDRPCVALQGHMDMVCVKTPDSSHDFTKDPIEVFQDGDFLKAKDTSLGGDDGIAVAMTMALFTDRSLKHGPLEAIFTFSEETGMDGAFALDGSLVRSRRMINLDSEDEGVIYIGCAGGIEVDSSLKLNITDVSSDYETVEISVSGMKGGHSGGEIHMQRANAIQVLSRMLYAPLSDGLEVRLAAFDGGTRRNVIAGSASAVICIPSDVKKDIMHRILGEFETIRKEYVFSDPDMTCTHHCTHCNPELKKAEKAADRESSEKIIRSVFCAPHGVYSRSLAVKDVIETSDNLAIAHLDADSFSLVFSVRSLVNSAKVLLAHKIKTIMDSFGYTSEIGGDYPSWAPDPSSPLAAFCAEAWKKTTGRDAVLTSIHAGLECGIINSRIPGMDSVSIGPNLYDVHSVNEKLSISSTERMVEFVKYLLEIIR